MPKLSIEKQRKALEKSIEKFGDYDGSKEVALNRLVLRIVEPKPSRAYRKGVEIRTVKVITI